MVDTLQLQPYSAARQSDGTSEPVNAEAGSHRGMLLCVLFIAALAVLLLGMRYVARYT